MYRKVLSLEVICESRFKDFYPDIALPSPTGQQPFSINIVNKNDNSGLDILNTKNPEPPKVDYLVPLIRWEKKSGEMTRYCDTIRIYFETWYNSGEDEQLAVFFNNTDLYDNPDFTDAPDHRIGRSSNPFILTNAISHIGKDPINLYANATTYN